MPEQPDFDAVEGDEDEKVNVVEELLRGDSINIWGMQLELLRLEDIPENPDSPNPVVRRLGPAKQRLRSGRVETFQEHYQRRLPQRWPQVMACLDDPNNEHTRKRVAAFNVLVSQYNTLLDTDSLVVEKVRILCLQVMELVGGDHAVVEIFRKHPGVKTLLRRSSEKQ